MDLSIFALDINFCLLC